MPTVFPLNVRISQIEGVISLVRDNDNSISMQKLSDEAMQEADDMFNIISACRMLKILKTKKGKIEISAKISGLGDKDIVDYTTQQIKKLQPFKFIIKNLKSRGMSTPELFELLTKKGYISYRDNMMGLNSFKKDLLNTGIRLHVLSYDHYNDLWNLTHSD